MPHRLEIVLHEAHSVDARLEVFAKLGKERCYFFIFKLIELGDDVITLFSCLHEVDKILQPLPAQAEMVDALREHSGEEENVVANVLAYLTLAIEVVMNQLGEQTL